MRLREIMHHNVEGMSPSGSLVDAISQLEKRKGDPLPVYEQGRLVGILTERDVISHLAKGGHDPKIARVQDAMSSSVPMAFEDEDVESAAEKVRSEHLDGLVVMRKNNREPIGTVSAADLAASGHATGMNREHMAARVFLQPIAAPSILGLFGFAGATFIVAANMAGWYGNTSSGLYLFPFALFFGGLAQFLAGMWSYKARDAVATAMHGMWGAFWMAYGLLNFMFAMHVMPEPHPIFSELGYWFIALGAITFAGMVGALAENLVLTGVLGTLSAGSITAACAYLLGSAPCKEAAGLLFVTSACLAFYLASAMMLESSYKRVVLPLGKWQMKANIPGSRITEAIECRHGQPGVKVGQ